MPPAARAAASHSRSPRERLRLLTPVPSTTSHHSPSKPAASFLRRRSFSGRADAARAAHVEPSKRAPEPSSFSPTRAHAPRIGRGHIVVLEDVQRPVLRKQPTTSTPRSESSCSDDDGDVWDFTDEIASKAGDASAARRLAVPASTVEPAPLSVILPITSSSLEAHPLSLDESPRGSTAAARSTDGPLLPRLHFRSRRAQSERGSVCFR